MIRAVSPQRLVRLANELAGIDAGPGQPRNTNLRRANSTAYYAIFHRLTTDVGRSVLPGGSDAEIYGLSRHISHTAIKVVCEWIGGDQPPKHLDPAIRRLRANPDVTAVAQAFLSLHEQRESADYDHFANFTKPTTALSVQTAGHAIATAYRSRDTETFRTFHGLIGMRASLSR